MTDRRTPFEPFDAASGEPAPGGLQPPERAPGLRRLRLTRPVACPMLPRMSPAPAPGTAPDASELPPTHARHGAQVLAAEVAVALTYDGSTEAVLMATPADLEDFAWGFTLTEGIADPGDIVGLEVQPGPLGVDLQIWLAPGAGQRLAQRRRRRIGPVGCGLCGIDSMAEAMRPLDPVAEGGLRLRPEDVALAVDALAAAQPLRDATRATHAAGFWTPRRGLVALREDVGRHNALDKLAGALVRQRAAVAEGAVVMTSRLSLDLVQKGAAIGVPVMLALAAPTTAAVAAAEAAGITVVAPARGGRCDPLTHPGRVIR